MIEIKNLCKTYSLTDGSVEALKDVSLSIPDGDVFGIIGMSGAGKSTLVRCINMLERPTAGSVVIDGKDLTKMTEKELRAERQSITMIFQGFNLLMQKNCLRNICFPLELAGVKKAEAIKKAQSLLELVGLGDKALAYPAQLSGGQQQRVAIARALATNPKVLLCDEATSALDPKTTNAILELIREINQKLGITVIIITHQMSVVESTCRHVAILEEGQVVEQGEVSAVFSHPKSEAARRLVFPEGNPESLLCSLPGSFVWCSMGPMPPASPSLPAWPPRSAWKPTLPMLPPAASRAAPTAPCCFPLKIKTTIWPVPSAILHRMAILPPRR